MIALPTEYSAGRVFFIIFLIIFALMKHPKFIITNRGVLRMDIVYLHRDLLMEHEDCLGGGFYEYDYVENRLILSGKSFDYGYPRWGRIDVLKVPEAFKGVPIIYRDPRGDELNLTTEFTIDYY